MHSPLQRGFWWGHLGWFTCDASFKTQYHRIKKFTQFPELVWLNRYDSFAPFLLIVLLYLADDELIATKENQYYQNAAAPSFHLQDLRSNYREQAHYNNDGSLELSVQEGAAAKIQSKRINDLPEDLIVDAGFDDFVRRHWSELETGKSVSFSFASAARLDLIDFRLQQKNINKDNLVLSMRLNSRLIAWLLDPIELTYNRQTKRLMHYRGLSNIQDGEGNTYSTDIRYHFK